MGQGRSSEIPEGPPTPLSIGGFLKQEQAVISKFLVEMKHRGTINFSTSHFPVVLPNLIV